MIPILLLAGCAGPPLDEDQALAPRQRLIRLSVDLRGAHPAEDELVAIEADPGLYEVFVDRYLDDPRAAERVRAIFNLRYQTRTGALYLDPADAGLGAVDAARVAAALADEPLQLISSTFEDDASLREVVLADYTMANEIVAAAWDLDYPAGASGWQRATYRDGRPHAGVLTMNTTWMRYPSMGGNANRHRANAVSRLLLCDDFLSRPIVLDRAAVDQLTEDPEGAIASNDSCQSCHATLDPLAAHFFGFFHDEDPDDLDAARTYRPENEAAWREWAGAPPAYFGVPTRGIPELAALIADDPRFESCAVEIVYGALGRPGAIDGAGGPALRGRARRDGR